MMKADHEAAMNFARLGAELFRVHHDPKSPNTLKPEVMHEANLSKAYLELAEQLAAEQEKVKALQPYKDAYDGGIDQIGAYAPASLAKYLVGIYETQEEARIDGAKDAEMHPVRVCKLVEGDSND